MAVCSLHHSVKRTDKHVVWSFDGFEWRAHTNKSTALTSQLKLTQLKWFVNGGQICVSRRRSANTCPNITNTYTKPPLIIHIHICRSAIRVISAKQSRRHVVHVKKCFRWFRFDPTATTLWPPPRTFYWAPNKSGLRAIRWLLLFFELFCYFQPSPAKPQTHCWRARIKVFN